MNKRLQIYCTADSAIQHVTDTYWIQWRNIQICEFFFVHIVLCTLTPRRIDCIVYLCEFHFQILLMKEEITSAELDFFLRFPIKPHVTSPVDFLSNTSWGGVCTLSAKEEFRYAFLFDRDVVSNSIIFHKINTLWSHEMYTRMKC